MIRMTLADDWSFDFLLTVRRLQDNSAHLEQAARDRGSKIATFVRPDAPRAEKHQQIKTCGGEVELDNTL